MAGTTDGQGLRADPAWAAAALDFQQQALDDLAADRPPAEVLDRLARAVDRLVPGAAASVLLLRDGRLYPGPGPGLPPGYADQYAGGLEPGPAAGSCGTAAHRREPVAVADIAADPLWAASRHLALPFGLRACWSVPILGVGGTVLGTFAVYHRDPRPPEPRDLRLVEAAARVARVALDRRAAEDRLRAFVDHCPAAAFVKDPAGRYVDTNPAWRAQFDPPPGDWAGKTDADFWPATTADLFKASDADCLAAGAVVQTEEVGRDPAGRTRVWQVFKFPVGVGGRRYVGGIAWDVTATRRAEAAARAAQARLLDRERREKEIVAAELARARAEVERGARLAALGQIAAGVAHDLRNPLGAVRTACYLLRRRGPADPAWADYLGLVDRELAACDRIISNLLELARPKPVAADAVDVGETARAAVARLAAPPGVRFVLTLDPDPLVVRADPVQVRQVFDNLLKNAADAVGEAGEVRVAGTAGPAGVRVVVADTGPGVRPADRPALFQPLFTTKAKGTGLGLWICQQVVERHGGTIRLLDDAGPGAAFEVLLPNPPAD